MKQGRSIIQQAQRHEDHQQMGHSIEEHITIYQHQGVCDHEESNMNQDNNHIVHMHLHHGEVRVSTIITMLNQDVLSSSKNKGVHLKLIIILASYP
jgi:hypothetical protein